MITATPAGWATYDDPMPVTSASPTVAMPDQIGPGTGTVATSDPEAALRASNAKFERRFRGMESLAAVRGVAFESLDLDAQERLWQEMKRGE